MNRQLCERREFLLMGLVLSAVAPSLLFADEALGAASPTPACGSHGGATASQSAGPYYRLDSPFKDDFTSDVSSGDQITVRGYVLDSGCRPIFGALLDFWQADQSGSYDNVGYRLRGHQFTDDQGRYVLRTIVPGHYPGRTRHIHVRVQRPNGRPLTTQLYFPSQSRNASDALYRPELLLKIDGDGNVGRFDFVLR
ncbi:intradiol ring-cleavage dioxygenase [Pararhizobium sp. A13]|uniref:dioxygenase family protein n=1 Tax=Pararhizobium sp. A13 TaxID=3133975 RepID=UPI00311AD359